MTREEAMDALVDMLTHRHGRLSYTYDDCKIAREAIDVLAAPEAGRDARAERPVDYEAAAIVMWSSVTPWEEAKSAWDQFPAAKRGVLVERAKRIVDAALARKVTDPCPDGDACPDARRYGSVHPTPEPAGELYTDTPGSDYRRSRPVWTRDDLLQNIDAFTKGRCTRGELADAILRGMK